MKTVSNARLRILNERPLYRPLRDLDDRARESDGDYTDGDQIHLTKSQEESGAIAAWCFVVLAAWIAVAGIAGLIRWALT